MSKRRLKRKDEARVQEREAQALARQEFFSSEDVCKVLDIDFRVLAKLQKFYGFPSAVSVRAVSGFMRRQWKSAEVKAWAESEENQSAIRTEKDLFAKVDANANA